jgi:hypothetical protein
VYQGADQSGELQQKISINLKTEILEDLYVNNEARLRDKNDRISFLEDEIAKLKVKDIPFAELSKEVKLLNEDLEQFSYSKRVSTNFENIDTIPVFNVTWSKSLRKIEKEANNKKLGAWLQFKLKLDTLVVLD